MFISTMVSACDIKDITYPTPVMGAAALARGATGRWCEVLWFGPEWIAEHPEAVLLSRDEASKRVEALGEEVDF